MRSIRKSYGFTRDELSETLSLTTTHLGLIERGERGMTAELLINISSIFKCSTDYLLTGKEHFATEIPISSNHAMAIDIMLEDNARQKLFEFIRSLSLQQRTQAEEIYLQ